MGDESAKVQREWKNICKKQGQEANFRAKYRTRVGAVNVIKKQRVLGNCATNIDSRLSEKQIDKPSIQNRKKRRSPDEFTSRDSKNGQANNYTDDHTPVDMSRGGRGGARGGILKGTTWDYDPNLKIDSRPSEIFPAREIPYSKPPSTREKREVANYIGFRSRVHEGPLYTKPRRRNPGERNKVYGEDQDNEQYTEKSAADFDPFTGVPTYSMKYEQKKREIPQLSERPFDKEFFPKELWGTISGESGKAVRASINKAIRRKEALANAGPMDAAARKAYIDKITEGIDDADIEDADAVREDDEAPEAEDVDDDYEGAEGEMGGDYDAEQYFDNGEDDDDDGDAGGGGDDY